MNKIIIFSTILLISLHSYGVTMTSAYENSRIKGLLKDSVITFSDKGVKTVYRPEGSPTLMTNSKKIPSDGKTFFLTMWAYGSRSVMYRVFDSSVSLSKPLCEIISFSDEPKYRIEDGFFELKALLIPGEPHLWEWTRCESKEKKQKYKREF